MFNFSLFDNVDAVVVHLRATGDAPILKQAKFKVRFNFYLGLYGWCETVGNEPKFWIFNAG